MKPKVTLTVSPQRINFPQEEEKVLKHWEQIDAFKQQLENTKDLKPFTFYDGPPFATGLPHYGHICAGTIKDVVCRYASQTGHYVERRFGWDCHGLPVQYEIDKKLEIKDRRQITHEMGIANYNKECRGIVMKYSSEWRKIVTRLGRWIDFDNDYKTLNLDFMESVWYVFKEIYNKGLVYRGRKIMPYSSACNTVLSNFETAQNYKSVNDPSVHITFPLLSDPTVKLVAWTTTPWTLPSNLALAVNPNFDYVKLKDIKRNEVYIIAQCQLTDLYKTPQEYQIIDKVKGSTLQGLQYEPLFQYFADRKKDGCFKVLLGDFVTTGKGTGIVHMSPGFGQEDYKLCVKSKIISPDDPPVPIDENGRFTLPVKDYEGLNFKDADKPIRQYLKSTGRLIADNTMKHDYPFCWRSDTPLMYRAIQTWFIKVTDIKQRMIENNKKAYWVPKQVQEGRFDSWLTNAEDWCFSRNRFWGNPIPLWVSQDGEQIVVVGSVQELKDLSGVQDITDLHRQSIDHITIPSKQGKGNLKRIEEVFDCWFESGSMPYAQVHYPFTTNEDKFKTIFPADFISEGIDQTRGWFYTLNVIATALKNDTPYKNLIVNGLVQAEDGTKLSKRLKNYPDPELIINQYGADALRVYLINSPLVKAQNLKFSAKGVQSVVKDVFLPWYNAYRFLTQNIVRLDKPFVFVGDVSKLYDQFNLTDKWIESYLQQLIKDVRKDMSQYKLYNMTPRIIRFLNDLTNWYVRLNRQRIKGEVTETDMQVSLNVLFDVVLNIAILLSPQAPFLTEYMYQNLRNALDEKHPLFNNSIHFVNIPQANEKFIDAEIQKAFVDAQQVIETARQLRDNKKISLKQPIMGLTVLSSSTSKLQNLKQLVTYIEEQVNVATVNFSSEVNKYVTLEVKPNFQSLKEKLKGNSNQKNIQQAIKKFTHEQICAMKDQETIDVLGTSLSTKEDILITQKFVTDNIEKHQAISGKNIFVLLDTRQDEGLRIKGFARQFINKIQRLKKKAKLNPQDNILIFFKLGQKSTMLAQALEKQRKMIEAAVRKPLVSASEYTSQIIIDREQGEVDKEQYEFFFTRESVIINSNQLQTSFADSHQVISRILLSTPYSKIAEESKTGKFKLNLDEKNLELEVNKHFRLPF